MKTKELKLCEITTTVLFAGFEGEQNYRRFVIDASEVFADMPDAVPGLAIKPPVGAVYPKAVQRDGNNVIFTISAADCAHEGNGEYQLTFSNGDAVGKVFKGQMRVYESLVGEGEAPDPVTDWVEAANATLQSLEEITATAEGLPAGTEPTAEVTDVGGHKNIAFGIPTGDPGQPGVSPAVTVTDITGGHRVTITDASGTRTFDVMDGAPGTPGVSPTVSVVKITGGHRVTITDAVGTSTFDVLDGAKGDPGDPTELIDDSSTTATDKVWSAKKSADEVSDLKSALTDKADIIISSASGSIASFPDGAEAPVKSLTVGIEPVQDLHGYDSPWPAGGGNNIWGGSKLAEDIGNASTAMVWDKTAKTIKIPINATPSGTEDENLVFTNGIVFEENTVYTLITDGTAAVYLNMMFKYTDGTTDRSLGRGMTIGAFSSASGKTVQNVVYRSYSGDTVLNYERCGLFKGSVSVSAYTPYSNICPITGWDAVKVTRTGKNLFDKSSVDVGFIESSSGNVIANTSYRHSAYIKITPGATYCSTDTGFAGANSGAFYDINKAYVIGVRINSFPGTFTAPANACYIRVSIDPAKIDTIQIELGSTATAYEPYQGQTYDIEFPSEAGTVYGATLTVNEDGAGTLVVDIEKRRVLASYNWYNGYGGFYVQVNSMKLGTNMPGLCSHLKTYSSSTIGTNLYIRFGNNDQFIYFGNVKNVVTDLSGWKSFLNENDVQIAYPLATPITYQLTPLEVSTLLGQNNIWADTGDVNLLEYPADTKLYIDRKITEAIANALNA